MTSLIKMLVAVATLGLSLDTAYAFTPVPIPDTRSKAAQLSGHGARDAQLRSAVRNSAHIVGRR